MTSGESPPALVLSRYAIPWPGAGTRATLVAILVLVAVVVAAVWALSAKVPPAIVLFGAGVLFYGAVASVTKKPRVVRVEGNALHGLGDPPLTLGDGYVVIRRKEWTSHYKGSTSHHQRFIVRYDARDILSDEDPLVVRTFAEALARIVRVPLHWEHDEPGVGAGTEMLAHVDAPLADRMRELSSGAAPLTEPADATVSIELHDDDVVLESRLQPRRAIVWLGAAGVAQTWLAFASFESESTKKMLLMLVAFAWTVGVASLPRALVTRRLQVDGNGITVCRRLLGAVPFFRKHIAAVDVDGLHIDDRDLLVTGRDASFARFTVGTSRGAVDWARGVVASVLTGERQLAPIPAPSVASVDAPRAKATHSCPRCLAKLGDNAGAFDDAICAQCRGRFLSPSGAERLLEGELGISKEILRGILQSFAGKRLTCPGCGSMTSPARLRGVACDLCTGCGGVWLDNGELGALTQGRHQG